MYKAMEETRSQQQAILESAGIENVALELAFQPIASSAVKACDEKGGNPMGLKAQSHNCMKYIFLLSLHLLTGAQNQGFVSSRTGSILKTKRQFAKRFV
jgi:hypothetical protein